MIDLCENIDPVSERLIVFFHTFEKRWEDLSATQKVTQENLKNLKGKLPHHISRVKPSSSLCKFFFYDSMFY